MPAIDIPVVATFLFNTFLIVFIFSIANVEAATASMLG